MFIFQVYVSIFIQDLYYLKYQVKFQVNWDVLMFPTELPQLFLFDIKWVISMCLKRKPIPIPESSMVCSGAW